MKISAMRKETEAEILYFIEKILPDGSNTEVYRKVFESMSDSEFAEWMDRLESGEEILALFKPNLSKVKLTMERNLAVSEELGYPLFQHLYLTDTETGITRKTNGKFMIGLVPVRRQVQTRESKMSVPDSDSRTDALTGQASGDSVSSRMSYPEIQVNLSKGLDNMLLELVKFRGGDVRAYNAMNKEIANTGSVSMDSLLSDMSTKVKSTETLSTILKSMHLNNNL